MMDLLVWSGVIWGHSGEILECRITVCNYSVELSIQNHNRHTLIGCIFLFLTKQHMCEMLLLYHIDICLVFHGIPHPELTK